jgi:hypothetical protein
LRLSHHPDDADAVRGVPVLAAADVPAERRLLILPEHGELCGCYAATEPLYSTRGLERCTSCGAIGLPHVRSDLTDGRPQGNVVDADADRDGTLNET